MQSAFMLSASFGGTRPPSATQPGFDFPMPLSEKYRPRALADFAGLERNRDILTAFAATPYESSWLFLGPSGTGKTTMAQAFADLLGADVKHIPSRECDLETVGNIIRKCWFVPMGGRYHVVLVDEADQMSHAAQLAFLSKLDSTAAPPKTIFVFTANATDLLQPRFLSRCRRLEFQAPGQQQLERLLLDVWNRERPEATPPEFSAIIRAERGNVRACLMALELEMYAPTRPAAAQVKKTDWAAAGRKAAATRRANLERRKTNWARP